MGSEHPTAITLFLHHRYGGGKDYLVAELENERIVVRFSVGSDQPARLQLGKVVSDRKWHILTITVKSKQIYVMVDECHDRVRSSCSASATVPGFLIVC